MKAKTPGKSRRLAALVTVALFVVSALSVLATVVPSAAATTTPASPSYKGQNFYFGLMSNDSTLDFPHTAPNGTWSLSIYHDISTVSDYMEEVSPPYYCPINAGGPENVYWREFNSCTITGPFTDQQSGIMDEWADCYTGAGLTAVWKGYCDDIEVVGEELNGSPVTGVLTVACRLDGSGGWTTIYSSTVTVPFVVRTPDLTSPCIAKDGMVKGTYVFHQTDLEFSFAPPAIHHYTYNSYTSATWPNWTFWGQPQNTGTNGCDNHYPTGTGWANRLSDTSGTHSTPYGCGQWIDQNQGFTQSLKSNYTSTSATTYVPWSLSFSGVTPTEISSPSYCGSQWSYMANCLITGALTNHVGYVPWNWETGCDLVDNQWICGAPTSAYNNCQFVDNAEVCDNPATPMTITGSTVSTPVTGTLSLSCRYAFEDNTTSASWTTLISPRKVTTPFSITVNVNPCLGGPYSTAYYTDYYSVSFTPSTPMASTVAYQGIEETQTDIVPTTGLTFSTQMTGGSDGTYMVFWDSKCITQDDPIGGPQVCAAGGTPDGALKYTYWKIGNFGGKIEFMDPVGQLFPLLPANYTGQTSSVEFLIRATTSTIPTLDELQIYYNVGNGYVLGLTYYSSTLAWMGTDGGKVILYADMHSTTVTQSSFAYFSVWTPNQVKAEGTFDNNMWYLSRHYETISGGSYSGDAVEGDTDGPPLMVNLTGVSSHGAVLYAGMAPTQEVLKYLGEGFSSSCEANCYVDQTASLTNPDYVTYNLANGVNSLGLSTDRIMITVQTEASTTSEQTTYVVQVHYSSSSYTGRRFSVYLGDDLLASGLNAHANATGTYTVTVPYELPGNRYVSRHITDVMGLLLEETGYGSCSSIFGNVNRQASCSFDMASPLLNFIDETMNLCSALETKTCTASTYTEYYGPMFGAAEDAALTSGWYGSYATFPQAGFYEVLPSSGDGVSFNQPNPTGYGYTPVAPFSTPYISRLSVTSSIRFLSIDGIPVPLPSVFTNADTMWVDAVQISGYTPSTQALRAQYTAQTGGSLATAEALLDSAGWDGTGSSLKVCIYTQCFDEASYPSYTMATFLSAASVVGSMAGTGSIWATEAREAAGVVEEALWSGTGYVEFGGQQLKSTDWRFVGGELAAYEPLADDPLSYFTNQAGLFNDVSMVLENAGINGVQPPESAAVLVANTEATGASAQALWNFLTYLPNQPEIYAVGTLGTPVGNVAPTVTGCSASSITLTGYFLFNETSRGTCSASYVTSETVANIGYTNLMASFHLNGTVNVGTGAATLSTTITLRTPKTSSNCPWPISLTGLMSCSSVVATGTNTTTVSRTGAIDKEIGVDIETPAVSAGQYFLVVQFSFTGVGTFDSSTQSPTAYFVKTEQLGIAPNSMSVNFVNNANYNEGAWFFSSSLYQAGTTETAAIGKTGLELNLQSPVAGREIDAGTVSHGYITRGASDTFHFEGNVTGQDPTTYLCFGISTTSLMPVIVSSMVPSGLFSQQSSFASFCDNSAGNAVLSFRNQNGAVQTWNAFVSGKNLQVGMEIIGTTLRVTYTTSSGAQAAASFVMNWNTLNTYVYSYATTKATSAQHVYLFSESGIGDTPPSDGIVVS
jgi:hypothetical protein